MAIRRARKDDADELAELINYAGEGLPLYLWTQMAAPGTDPWETGRERALREAGGFSYRNGIVAEMDDRVAGALIGYPLADDPPPIDAATVPAMFLPVLELEHIAAGTWYVNAVSVFPEGRRLGVGSMLLAEAERIATSCGCRGLSLIVSDTNDGAQRLYERLGYRECARRAMVKEQWQHEGDHWLLMERRFYRCSAADA